MTLCIALCDDDKIALNNELRLIKDVLNEKKIKHSIDIFSSPQKLLQSDTVYDIIFLDIEMAEMDGISLAEKISITNKSCLFFFVTSPVPHTGHFTNPDRRLIRSGSSRFFLMISTIPMIPLIGVRISWDIWERNSLLA